MIRATVAQDLIDFAPNIRDADEQEVRSLTGLDPLAALSVGLFHSRQCMSGISKDGDIVMIFGVVPYDHIRNPIRQAGSIWMMSTDAIAQNTRELVREGKRWVDEQAALYPVLTNVVDERNVIHQRLIKHMGFRFRDPINNYGVDRIRVIPFER